MRRICEDACSIAYEVCPTELEASLLESSLIRELRPKWNVAGAFYFLYPMIGIKAEGTTVLLCYTTTPEAFPGFELHGAYRSRGIAGEAFFALTRLLPYLLHPIPPAQLLGKQWREKKPKYSYLFGFRAGLSEGAFGAQAWQRFFSGRDHAAIEELSLALLEHAGARGSAEQVQDDLRAVHRFWRHEALPLARAISRTGHGAYPVAQTDRDDLFLRSRFGSAAHPAKLKPLVEALK
jgi:hypothetical protein